MRNVILIFAFILLLSEVCCCRKLNILKPVALDKYNNFKGIAFVDCKLEGSILFLKNPKIELISQERYDLVDKNILMYAFNSCFDSLYLNIYNSLPACEANVDFFDIFEINDSIDQRFITSQNLYSDDFGNLKLALNIEFDGMLIDNFCDEFIFNYLNVPMLIEDCKEYLEPIEMPITIYSCISIKSPLTKGQLKSKKFTSVPFNHYLVGQCD